MYNFIIKLQYHFILLMILFCFLSIFIGCGGSGNTLVEEPEQEEEGTWIEFNNLEDFTVSIYSDPARQYVITTVEKKSSKKIEAIPNITGIVFYPTFFIDIPYIQDVFIPHNAPEIITVIEEDKTTKVPVPILEKFEFNRAYIRVVNDSNYSLSFQYGNTELSPLGGRPNIIVPNQSAVYEIIPGNVSGFSLRRNTTTPINYPDGLDEFEPGKLYSITYSGSNLILLSVLSLPASPFPSSPRHLKAELLSTTSVRLTWDNVFGATSYRIYRESSQIGLVTSLSYTINDLLTGANYIYSVRARENNVEGQASQIIFSMPPNNIRMTNRTNTAITITWDTVTGTSGYNIYRSDSVNGIYTKLNGSIITANNYLDNGLYAGTNYYYRIAAVISGTQSLESIPILISTLSNVPGNLIIAAVDINSITIKWDAVGSANGYNIYRSDSFNGIYDKLNTSLITSDNYRDIGLLINTTYFYKVTSIISGIENDFSIPLSVSTLSDVPINTRVTAMNMNSITLGWNIINGVSGYNIYRSNNENGTYNKLNTNLITDNRYIDTELTAYATYYYKVTSSTSGIESDYSGIVTGSAGVIVPGSSLAAKLTWLKSNALSNSFYAIEISENEIISPQDLTYSGKSNISITLSSTGNTINLSSNGILFTISSGVTLILNNITLNGRTNNNDSLVRINDNGTLILNEGAKISGNSIIKSYENIFGGGVYLNGGTIIMNGGQITGNSVSSSSGYYSRGGGIYIGSGVFTLNAGEISGNSAHGTSSSTYAHGGGVYITNGIFNMNGGEIFGNSCSSITSSYNVAAGIYITSGSVKFRMSGGVVYGNNAPVGFKNTATNSSALYCASSGIAQYGVINNNTFYRYGDFNTSVNTTIRVVDGSLVNE